MVSLFNHSITNRIDSRNYRNYKTLIITHTQPLSYFAKHSFYPWLVLSAIIPPAYLDGNLFGFVCIFLERYILPLSVWTSIPSSHNHPPPILARWMFSPIGCLSWEERTSVSSTECAILPTSDQPLLVGSLSNQWFSTDSYIRTLGEGFSFVSLAHSAQHTTCNHILSECFYNNIYISVNFFHWISPFARIRTLTLLCTR